MSALNLSLVSWARTNIDFAVVPPSQNKTKLKQIIKKHLTSLQSHFKKCAWTMTWDKRVINRLVSLEARETNWWIDKFIFSDLLQKHLEGIILQRDAQIHLSMVSKNIELIVLDTGKAVRKQKRIVYLNPNGQSLQNLVGKQVHRISPMRNDRSYMNDCIKILYVSSQGETIYKETYRAGGDKGFLSPCWNDNNWVPVSPVRNGRAFFENLATDIQHPEKKKTVFALIKMIFEELDTDCHLSNESPFNSLKEYCVAQEKPRLFLEEVRELEKLLKPISVKFLPKKKVELTTRPQSGTTITSPPPSKRQKTELLSLL